MESQKIINHFYDAIVVGGGGAGLRTCLGLAQKGFKVACISKIFPTRSHTVAAQGGISAALNNQKDGDNWKNHFYDTVKGSDWLGDQDAIAYMCQNAAQAVIELEHMGVPFSRDENGLIYQRQFGGHTIDKGKSMAKRACAASDKTGHAILHTLYQQCLKHNTEFFIEYFSTDLIMSNDQECLGVLAWCLEDGSLHSFEAKVTILATGGHGRVYANCTGAYTCTGDGNAMVLRQNLPLQDMEFVQFHPTGIYGAGCLISEAARGEGGFLQNALKENFMVKYAPHAKDLASRDVVSRAISIEILEGRGCGENKDYIDLNLTHLPKDVIDINLKGIKEIAKIFADVDVKKQSIPIQPTVHYNMGGIPTNLNCEVIGDDKQNIVPNLLAVGEAACISVHGANRLGANSLLDLIVFGKVACETASKIIMKGDNFRKNNHNQSQAIDNFFSNLSIKGDIQPFELRKEMRNIMQSNCSVFRNQDLLIKAKTELGTIHQSINNIRLNDRTLIWNTEFLEILEFKNLIVQAIATVESALYRTESRGSHYRNDYPERDDENWLNHTLFWFDKQYQPKLAKKPVRLQTLNQEVDTVKPEKRIY